MNPFDDERYICEDNIKTLPFCDYFSSFLHEMIETVKFR